MEYGKYRIIPDADFPTMKKIEFVGRGSIHLSLRGHFTSIGRAKEAIDDHVKKGGGDGETSSSGRD